LLSIALCLTLISQQDGFQNTYLGGILIFVALLNAFIEFYQLQKSEAILASFLAMIPPSCRVMRDGTISTIQAADLVKGDVVLLVRIFLPAITLLLLTICIIVSAGVTKLLQIWFCLLVQSSK
jgi:magnesium-transporting ATPase (P-type)